MVLNIKKIGNTVTVCYADSRGYPQMVKSDDAQVALDIVKKDRPDLEKTIRTILKIK